MNTLVGDKEFCSEYVVCNCPEKYIKLALPIYVSPSGTQIACLSCHAALDDCPPALLSEVRRAGLPQGQNEAA